MKSDHVMRKTIVHTLTIFLIMGALLAGSSLFGSLKADKAYAYTEEPASITQLDPELSDGKVTNAHEVTFAGKKWLVIGYDGVGDTYSEGDTKITLLAKNCLLNNVNYSSSEYVNEYSNSIPKTQLASYVANTSNFNAEEQAAIITRTLQGGSDRADGAVDYVSGNSVDAKLWPLSSAEACMLSQSIVALESEYWLRSPGYTTDYYGYYSVSYVWSASNTEHQGVNTSGYKVNTHAIGVRPALQLDLSRVVYNPSGKNITASTGILLLADSVVGEKFVYASSGDRPLSFYVDSVAQGKCTSYYESLSESDQKLITGININEDSFTDENGNYNFSEDDKLCECYKSNTRGAESGSTDKVFILSMREFFEYKDSVPNFYGKWWLRSYAGELYGYTFESLVQESGAAAFSATDEAYMRPALYLNTSAFTSYDVDSEGMKTWKPDGAGSESGGLTDIKKGDKVSFAGMTWTVLEPKPTNSDGTANLAAARTIAKNELAEYKIAKGENNYYEEEWTAMDGMVEAGKGAIDAATSIANIDTALENAKKEIDAVQNKEAKDYSTYIPATEDNADALTSKQVTFNGKKWYIIKNKAIEAKKGTVTLLAAEPIAASKFNSGSDGNAYSGSTVQGVLNGMTDGGEFSGVAPAIKSVDLPDVSVEGAKLYLLSYDEADSLPKLARKCQQHEAATAAHWWLRTAAGVGNKAKCVIGFDGYLDGDTSNDVSAIFGVRPALTLDLSRVNFTPETRVFLYDDPVGFNNLKITSPVKYYNDLTVGDILPVTSSAAFFNDPTDQTVMWKATDDNGDPLTGKLEFYSDAECTKPLGDVVPAGTIYVKAVGTGRLQLRVYAHADSKRWNNIVINIKENQTVTSPTANDLKYTGQAQTLITPAQVTTGNKSEGSILYSLNNRNWSAELPKGTDAKEYTVYYKVAGDDNYNEYTGEPVSATIGPKSIADGSVTITVAGGSAYDGTGQKPAVTVKDGVSDLTNDDFEVAYSDNINAGENAKVTITGKGNYGGSVEKTFTIARASLENAEIVLSTDGSIKMEGKDVYVQEAEGAAVTPAIASVKAGDKELSAEDYDVTYSNNTVPAADAKVTLAGKGNYKDTAEVTFEIVSRAEIERAEQEAREKAAREKAAKEAAKKAAAEKAAKAAAEKKAKKITNVKINTATVSKNAVNAAVKKAGGSTKYVKTFTLGNKVKTIKAKTFVEYKKAVTLVIQTKKLTKNSINASLKGSKITKINIKVGNKKMNIKYIKKYKKIFTKKNTGNKVKII